MLRTGSTFLKTIQTCKEKCFGRFIVHTRQQGRDVSAPSPDRRRSHTVEVLFLLAPASLCATTSIMLHRVASICGVSIFLPARLYTIPYQSIPKEPFPPQTKNNATNLDGSRRGLLHLIILLILLATCEL